MGKTEQLARLMEVQRVIQEHFPECVLVGGTAAAIHAGHRYSLDLDSELTDLKKQFPEVLGKLQELAGWTTNRVNFPVQILGSFEGVEVGIRQLIRSAPLETEEVVGILVPTIQEILRVKAFLIVKRNALRDYLDFCALAGKIGEGFEAAMDSFDHLYPQPPRGDTTAQELCRRLAQPRPKDYNPGMAGMDLTSWRGLEYPWTDWAYVENFARTLGGRLFDRVHGFRRQKEV